MPLTHLQTSVQEHYPMEETLRIERLLYGSAGIAHRANGKTVFIDGVAPGDLVRVCTLEEKPNFDIASLVEVLEPSASRTTPLCPHAGICGGCPWAHIGYAAQLEAKRASVVSALVRTAHFEAETAEELVAACLPSKRETGYRNKLELATMRDSAGRFQLGMHQAGATNIVPIEACPLAVKPIQKAPKALQGALRYLQRNEDLGIFRVGVRCSLRTHDIEIALWTTPGPFPRKTVASTLSSALKATSIVRVIADPGKKRTVRGVEQLVGKGCWEGNLWEGRVNTSAPSVFQVNTAQAEYLVETVLDGFSSHGLNLNGALAADLYAGGGTFSIAMAKAGADVIAVESAGSSVRDLRRNADLNQVFVEVVGGDSARELKDIGELDVLVVDPPRAGLAKGVTADIAAAGPELVAYVSCDPATWARDIARFAQDGYKLVMAQPVDMFPQTYHVECAALLKKE